ncbi:MAG: hypothetical protein ACQETO_00155 [Pseudomonadota bacterium]
MNGAWRVDGLRRPDLAALSVGFILLLGLQIVFILHHNINWDEFYFLSLIHDAQRGTLDSPLRTIHVHLFGWVTRIPGNEIQQVIAGRWGMFVAQLLTLVSLVVASRRFVPTPVALFAALAWLATGFTLTQGFSFRTDPLATSLLMGAIALTLTPSMTTKRAAIAGGLVGLAGLVTIKAVLYLPAFLGVLLWHTRQHGQPRLVVHVLSGTLSAAVCFVALYLLHGFSLGIDPADAASGNTAFAGRAGRSMLLEAGLLPQAITFLIWLVLSFSAVVLLIVGSTRGTVALLFAAPLLSVLFYRNSFAYFYPFITAPAMITLAIGAHTLYRWSRPVFLVICVLMLTSAVMQTTRGLPKGQVTQRQTLAAVHDIFNEPVAYIDRNSMVSSFPKQGFFMTGWGLSQYLDRGEPVMDDLLASQRPPLLLANGPALQAVFTDNQQQWLLDEDVEVLRQAYVPYWGAIHIAGFQITFPPSSPSDGQRHPVRIAGDYRIETDNPVQINGILHESGETIMLQRGGNRFVGEPGTTTRLIWNAAGVAPDHPPPEQPLYHGF